MPDQPPIINEALAKKKFSCPSCGAEAQWNPDKKALVCPYCNTVSPAQAELTPTGETVIVEHDLVAALRGIPDAQRGWQAKKTSVRCQSCQAISVFDPERVSQRCDFCGSTALVPYEEIKEAFSPESLLPMKLSENQMRDTIRQWYGSRWFAPNKLKHAALTDTVKGLYIPYWTFDAQVHADWTAESGYYYYTTETYTDSQGKTQTRQVQHTRWVPSSGAVDHFFDDELVPASSGVHAERLRNIEPFPRRNWWLTMRVFCRAGWWSGIRLISSPPRRKRARKWIPKWNDCAPRRCRATRIAVWTSNRIIRVRRSSTFWCRSGCSLTITARRISRW